MCLFSIACPMSLCSSGNEFSQPPNVHIHTVASWVNPSNLVLRHMHIQNRVDTWLPPCQLQRIPIYVVRNHSVDIPTQCAYFGERWIAVLVEGKPFFHILSWTMWKDFSCRSIWSFQCRYGVDQMMHRNLIQSLGCQVACQTSDGPRG